MNNNKQASILLLALWVLFFLAALTVATAGHVLAVLQAADRLQSRVLARMEATSAAAWAVAILEEQQHQTRETNVWDGVSEDAWNRNVRLFVLPGDRDRRLENTVYFMVPDADEPYGGIIGESGRLHLNSENPELLKRLFAYLGGEAGAQLARTLFQGSGEGDGGLTGRGDEAYDSAAFQTVEDLLAIDGVDAALYAKLAPHLTVYGRSDIVNVNSASHAVLVAYLLATDDEDITSNAEALADQIVAARSERGFLGRQDFEARLPELAGGIWARWPMGIASTAFRGIAVGTDRRGGETELEIEFVWDTIAGRYVVWRER